MSAPPSPTQDLATIGRALFGEDWAGPLAGLANVNARTLSRIKAAAAAGEEYPAARGVLAALYEALEALLATLEPYRR